MAVGHLSPLARAWVRPMFDVPRPKPQGQASLEQHLLAASAGVADFWGTAHPIFFDFSQYAPDEISADGLHPIKYSFGVARQLGLQAIPVAGPLSVRGPGSGYVEAIARIAGRDGRGAALRIPYHELSRPEILETSLVELLRLLRLRSEMVDVFLDFEAIERLHVDEQDEAALLAIATNAGRVVDGHRFRNVIVCGSSLREKLGKRHDWRPVRLRRKEVGVWRDLLARARGAPAGFGDYGVVYPFESDTDKPVRPPSRIRLCASEEHVIYRAKPEEYRALCRAALERKKTVLNCPIAGVRMNSSGARRVPREAATRPTGSPETRIFILRRRRALSRAKSLAEASCLPSISPCRRSSLGCSKASTSSLRRLISSH